MRYNGNYDFSLSVTQYSREPKLKIQFKRPTPATTGRVKLTVYNPYGRIMFKEEYYVSKNERKTVDVTLPLGKYKVEVSAVKGGELYDWINEYVRLGDYIKYDHTISSDELKELYYHRSIEKFMGGIPKFAVTCISMGSAMADYIKGIVDSEKADIKRALNYTSEKALREALENPVVGMRIKGEVWQSGGFIHISCRLTCNKQGINIDITNEFVYKIPNWR